MTENETVASALKKAYEKELEDYAEKVKFSILERIDRARKRKLEGDRSKQPAGLEHKHKAAEERREEQNSKGEEEIKTVEVKLIEKMENAIVRKTAAEGEKSKALTERNRLLDRKIEEIKFRKYKTEEVNRKLLQCAEQVGEELRSHVDSSYWEQLQQAAENSPPNSSSAKKKRNPNRILSPGHFSPNPNAAKYRTKDVDFNEFMKRKSEEKHKLAEKRKRRNEMHMKNVSEIRRREQQALTQRMQQLQKKRSQQQLVEETKDVRPSPPRRVVVSLKEMDRSATATQRTNYEEKENIMDGNVRSYEEEEKEEFANGGGLRHQQNWEEWSGGEEREEETLSRRKWDLSDNVMNELPATPSSPPQTKFEYEAQAEVPVERRLHYDEEALPVPNKSSSPAHIERKATYHPPPIVTTAVSMTTTGSTTTSLTGTTTTTPSAIEDNETKVEDYDTYNETPIECTPTSQRKKWKMEPIKIFGSDVEVEPTAAEDLSNGFLSPALAKANPENEFVSPSGRQRRRWDKKNVFTFQDITPMQSEEL